MYNSFFIPEISRHASRRATSMATTHVHDTHEMYLLISGQRRYMIGHTIYDLAPGNLVFVPASLLHRTSALGDRGYDRYVINFSQDLLTRFWEQVGQTPPRSFQEGGCLQLPAAISAKMQKEMAQIEQLLRQPDEWTQGMVTHILYGILLDALRCGAEKKPPHGETTDKIQQVALYISQHYAEYLSLENAAQMAHMEKTYFSKRFKAMTGFGFLEYLTQTRLQVARHMLKTTTLSIGEISESCGFTGANYFGDLFRRNMGMSPSEYRLNYGEYRNK